MKNTYSPLTLVMIHGFLDSSATWAPLRHELRELLPDCLAPDLRGAGRRNASGGPFTLQQAARDVLDQLEDSQRNLVFVGHSMGAQIAELAAMQAIDRTSALVLITPTPLQGNVLPDEVRAMLRESGGNPEAQKQIRKAFSTHLPHEAMDLDPSIIMGPETVRGYYDAFTTGDPVGAAPSTYTGPTLLIGAEQDPVIPVEMVRQIRDERFPGAELALINESGHWPQVEQPGQLGRHLAEFLRRRQN